MKKRLLWLLLMPIIIGGISIVNASDTSCWEGKGIVPTTTYASGIVYGCDGNTPIITVYGDDGKGITIKAMNEGATAIGAKNDSTGSYGNSYQWGNNYGFPFASGKDDINISTEYTSTKVDVANYGPVDKSVSGYYDSGMWIPQWQWSTDNRNLRGGSGDEKGTNGKWGFDTDYFVAINTGDRKGMCDDGYHIPSQGEWAMLMQLRLDKYPRTETVKTENNDHVLEDDLARNYIYDEDGEIGNDFSSDMMLPFVGYRRYDGFVYIGDYGYYWSSSPDDYGTISRYFSLDPYDLDADNDSDRGYGYAVRCFKNSYVELPKTLNLFFMSDDEEVGTGEVTEDEIYTGTIPNETKTEYILEYRVLYGGDSTTGFDFENEAITGGMADESGNVYFIAKWTPIEYKIDYKLDGGTNSPNNVTGYTIETDTITLENPTKDGYNFDGWFTDTGFTTQITEITQGNTGDVTLYAKWTQIETRPSGGSSGGGGRSSKTSDTQDSSAMPQNDKNTGNVIQSETKGSEESSKTPMDSSDKSSEGQNQQQFTKEFQEAYEFAKEKGITTMPTINDANMNGKLTRIAMAKMLSYYAINVLGMKPDETRNNKFNDISDKLDAQYDSGVTLAYQLGIMGINMPNNKFRPNDEVTRAEFATALSRMLYYTSDGEYKSTDKYYTNHMKKLVQEGIITNDDAKMKELRGYVMIMLMRSAK